MGHAKTSRESGRTAKPSARDSCVVGIISDTHGILDRRVIDVFSGVAHIIHAGDVGAGEVLAGLSCIAPVTAVRGNMDSGALAWDLPQQAVVEVCGVRFLVEHDRAALIRAVDPRALGVDVVVTGHSHAPAVEWSAGVLYLNPGAAGRRRFRLPKAVAVVGLLAGKEGCERIQPEIVVLEEGSAYR